MSCFSFLVNVDRLKGIMLKKKIEEMIPDDIQGILDYLGEERIKAKVEILDPNKRREYLVQLANQCLQYEKGKE